MNQDFLMQYGAAVFCMLSQARTFETVSHLNIKTALEAEIRNCFMFTNDPAEAVTQQYNYTGDLKKVDDKDIYTFISPHVMVENRSNKVKDLIKFIREKLFPALEENKGVPVLGVISPFAGEFNDVARSGARSKFKMPARELACIIMTVLTRHKPYFTMKSANRNSFNTIIPVIDLDSCIFFVRLMEQLTRNKDFLPSPDSKKSRESEYHLRPALYYSNFHVKERKHFYVVLRMIFDIADFIEYHLKDVDRSELLKKMKQNLMAAIFYVFSNERQVEFITMPELIVELAFHEQEFRKAIDGLRLCRLIQESGNRYESNTEGAYEDFDRKAMEFLMYLPERNPIYFRQFLGLRILFHQDVKFLFYLNFVKIMEMNEKIHEGALELGRYFNNCAYQKARSEYEDATRYTDEEKRALIEKTMANYLIQLESSIRDAGYDGFLSNTITRAHRLNPKSYPLPYVVTHFTKYVHENPDDLKLGKDMVITYMYLNPKKENPGHNLQNSSLN